MNRISWYTLSPPALTLVTIVQFLSFLVLSQISFMPTAFCRDKPFGNAANWGGTGLMEIPTARILEDGEIRFGYAEADPYRWYAGGMGVFPGLELSGRYTEIKNIPSGLGAAYGAYKDKAFDLKYQILPESKKLPAIALGLHDFHGTRLFKAQYLVISRQIFPVDFTIGLGHGRLRGPASFPSSDKLGLFGGIEWALHDRLHLLAEYNPIEYEKDKAEIRGVPEGAEWPVNIGARIKVFPGVNLGVSFQRGDTIGFMIHAQAKLGEPLLPKRPDPPLRHSVDRRPFRERDPREMVERIHEAIREKGFQDVSVYTDGSNLAAEFENNKYLYSQKAVGRVLRILLFHSPADTRKLIVIVKRQRMPILEVSVTPEHLKEYLFGNITEDIFARLLDVKTASAGLDAKQENIIRAEGKKKPHYRFGIKPNIETYFNDPSGVLKVRLGIKPYIVSTLWKGASVFARYDIPFYSNIESSNIPLPDAVRSDSWLYSDRDYFFDRLMLDQTIRLSDTTFGRLSCGYFETMYAGAGGEILTFLREGNLAVGIEGDWVRKREPGTQFDLLDLESHTLLGNIYCRVPQIDVTLQAQYGRFLAGDRGWMFRVSREYSTGVMFGFWYSFTDTDDLTEFNKDYHHKGVFLSLPARIFLNRDSTTRYHYEMSPWTRDVAATVFHWQDLFRMGAGLMPAEFKEDLSEIRK